MRSGKRSDLHADILEGHFSSALCHLGNISYRLGETQAPGKDVKAFFNNVAGAEAMARMEKHLADNKVELDKTPMRVGPKLLIDPKTETFTNNKDANLMLTREYRKGFEVPSNVG